MESLELRVSIITILEDCLRVVIPCTITGSVSYFGVDTHPVFGTIDGRHVDIRTDSERDGQ